MSFQWNSGKKKPRVEDANVVSAGDTTVGGKVLGEAGAMNVVARAVSGTVSAVPGALDTNCVASAESGKGLAVKRAESVNEESGAAQGEGGGCVGAETGYQPGREPGGGVESGEGLSLWGPMESYRDAPRSQKMTAPELTARSLPE